MATTLDMIRATPMLNMMIKISATGASSHCHVIGSPVIKRIAIMMGIA